MKLLQKISLFLLISVIIAILGFLIKNQRQDQSQSSALAKDVSQAIITTKSKPSTVSSQFRTIQKSEIQKAVTSTTQSQESEATVSQKISESVPTSRTSSQITQTLSPLEQFNAWASQTLAQMILEENISANGGQANLIISESVKDVNLAEKECEWNNTNETIKHNYIPAPGGQNIAGGHYQVEMTKAGAEALAQRLFEGYYSEKTGYNYLLKAGYTPEQIVNGNAQVTVAGITYSAKGMAGTGFETNASGGVVSHYAEIANQVPSHKATKFSVSVVYDPQKNFVNTAADFFCGEVSYVYQMDSDGQMTYVKY